MRTNTIEELEKEYNRLLNFADNSESNGFMLEEEFEGNNFMNQGDNWLFEAGDKGISWYELE